MVCSIQTNSPCDSWVRRIPISQYKSARTESDAGPNAAPASFPVGFCIASLPLLSLSDTHAWYKHCIRYCLKSARSIMGTQCMSLVFSHLLYQTPPLKSSDAVSLTRSCCTEYNRSRLCMRCDPMQARPGSVFLLPMPVPLHPGPPC